MTEKSKQNPTQTQENQNQPEVNPHKIQKKLLDAGKNLGKKAGAAYQRFDQSAYSLWLWSIIFIAGFLLNALTARRIDDLKSTVLTAFFAIFGGIFVLMSALFEHHTIQSEKLLKFKNGIQFAAQFCLGGLFSKNLEFYFQSAVLFKTFAFMGILTGAAYLAEVFKRRISRSAFQLPLYFLALFSFFTFFIPILTKKMTKDQFFLGGLIAFGLCFIYVFILWVMVLWKKQYSLKPRFGIILSSIAVLFALKVLLYQFNIIPPVPIAIRFAGVFHTAIKSGDKYQLAYEANPVKWEFWRKTNKTFLYQEGDTIFCFASVFAPTELKKRVYHAWRYKDSKRGWVQTDSLSYQLTGGRETGFRGFTYKRVVFEGPWEVDIMTEDGFLLGRVDFTVKKIDKTNRKLVWITR